MCLLTVLTCSRLHYHVTMLYSSRLWREVLKKYMEELMEFKRREEMGNKEGGDGDGDA